MYTENDRTLLLNQISEFVKDNCEFECLLQIGSGADGFTDIYSDIDLMAGCVDTNSVELANRKFSEFFRKNGAVYLDYRRWSDTVLGISAYYKNGLSVDLSFMPTNEMPIRASKWLLLWSLNENIGNVLANKANNLPSDGRLINEQYHHRFFFALRKVEIGILRENYIYADIVLNEARQMLLLIEVFVEGKKTHQFKAFNTLNEDFLKKLQGTYPAQLNQEELNKAKEHLMSMYLNIIDNNGLYKINDTQFMIINCFRA